MPDAMAVFLQPIWILSIIASHVADKLQTAAAVGYLDSLINVKIVLNLIMLLQLLINVFINLVQLDILTATNVVETIQAIIQAAKLVILIII